MSAPPNNSAAHVEQSGASDESLQAVHAALLHHNPEPREGYSLLPLGVLGFMSTMIFVCCIYFVHNRGGFNPLVTDGRLNPSSGPVETKLTDAQIVKKGQSLFNQTCIQCHQATGLGVAGAYPPLAGSDWVNGGEERLIRIVLDGLKDPVTVSGAQFSSSNKMPNFSAIPGTEFAYNWNDDKISYVLSYVRQEWGNKAPIVTGDAVKAIHALPGVADRKTPWTQAELLAIPVAPPAPAAATPPAAAVPAGK